MSKHVFTVSKMNCNGCVSTIRQGLESDKRVQSFDIKLSKKLVSVEGELSNEEAAEIIRTTGYDPETESEKKGFLSNLFSG